jgi:hypothetical protein
VLITCFLFIVVYHGRLSISIEHLFSKKAQKKIPVLSVIDDGHGMTYPDMMRMISFGHKRPNEHREDQIGRFGIGFKVEISQLKMASSSVSVFLSTQRHRFRLHSHSILIIDVVYALSHLNPSNPSDEHNMFYYFGATETVLSEGSYLCDAENLFVCYSTVSDDMFILL